MGNHKCYISVEDADVAGTLKVILNDLIHEDRANPDLVISDDMNMKSYPDARFLYLGQEKNLKRAGYAYDKNILLLRSDNIFQKVLRKLSSKNVSIHVLILDRIAEIRSAVKKLLNDYTKGRIRFLVRVDDFPRWDRNSEEFLEFHDVLSENKIPYLLGVTPLVCSDPPSHECREYRKLNSKEAEILQSITGSGAEIALHGITHQTRDLRYNSEFVGLDSSELDEKIVTGLNELKSHGLETDVFIPPFNTFDYNSLGVLKKYFEIICGGPESIPLVGYRMSPSFINGCLYIPSYHPAYGKAGGILEFVKKARLIEDNIVVPLTLHWCWEKEDNFASLKLLCREIGTDAIRWGML